MASAALSVSTRPVSLRAATASQRAPSTMARAVVHSVSGTRSSLALGSRTQLAVRPVQATRVARVAARRAPAAVVAMAEASKDKTVLVVGATGYIGRFVTKEMISRGYKVIAMSREQSGVGGKKTMDDVKKDFEGAEVVFGSVKDKDSIREKAFAGKVDVVVSCLASRTGGIKDSWEIDYEATKNVMDVAVEKGADQFVLLSAICVQKPLLTFQAAKLKFEEALMASGLKYSIVRPTAFFKSLGGQVAPCKGGGPYVMFGDGQLAACKPISERDLASYMALCIEDASLHNKVLPIGGPGKALTALEQGTMLFKLMDKEPNFIKVPIEIMTGVIKVLDVLAGFFPGLVDAAEFGKIGKYYAAESMLVLNPETGEYDADMTPSYGEDTLEAFFKKCLEEGMEGQELGDAAVWGQK